jgi:hypothetical protein
MFRYGATADANLMFIGKRATHIKTHVHPIVVGMSFHEGKLTCPASCSFSRGHPRDTPSKSMEGWFVSLTFGNPYVELKLLFDRSTSRPRPNVFNWFGRFGRFGGIANNFGTGCDGLEWR